MVETFRQRKQARTRTTIKHKIHGERDKGVEQQQKNKNDDGSKFYWTVTRHSVLLLLPIASITNAINLLETKHSPRHPTLPPCSLTNDKSFIVWWYIECHQVWIFLCKRALIDLHRCGLSLFRSWSCNLAFIYVKWGCRGERRKIEQIPDGKFRNICIGRRAK